jgi:hypothetical protein
VVVRYFELGGIRVEELNQTMLGGEGDEFANV